MIILDAFKRKNGSWIEAVAAFWALIFALLHVVWAMGWYIGLNPEAARKAFARSWFLAYDLIAAGLCFLGAAVALIKFWGRRLPRLLAGILVWTCAGILALRGLAGVVKAVYLLAGEENVSTAISFWDAWFCLGGILFGASALRFWQGTSDL